MSVTEYETQVQRGGRTAAESAEIAGDQEVWSSGEQEAVSGGQDRNEQKTALQKIMSFSVDFGPSRRDILHFTNQLAVMIKAGIGIDEALGAMAAQSENPKFSQIIRAINNDVKAGCSLSQALAKYPDLFSNLYVNMVAAAEMSGSLSTMLERLADYLDQEADTRSQVRSAMVYPIIIAVMAVSVTTFLLIFVLPRFVAIFEGYEHLLPLPTKMIMAASAFLRGWWFLIIPALGGVAWGFSYFIGTPGGKEWWDKVKLVVPLMRKLCRSLYITRSLHTMGVLVNAGVPILNTISITSEISGNIHFKRMWQRVHDSVKQGQKIASGLSGNTLLPVSVVQMIRSGEESGRLSDVLADVSEYYARELRTVIKTVTSMIEPIMIVVMGLLVGFIAMSIILPIFKMSSVVSGR